jgi:CPA1 family monovalent cation:H+ antiporter
MSLFDLFAILITTTALLSYVNARLLRLPPTIGVLASSLVLSLALVLFGRLGLGVEAWAERLLVHVDFDDLLMRGMLSFLLFAGALHVDLDGLLARRWTILSLATVGVVVSTILIGLISWGLFSLLGFEIPLPYALLFGALITPTDPIAVLAMLKTSPTPAELRTMIAGESLFNDGVGVVAFTLIAGAVVGHHPVTPFGALELLLVEAVGGALLGFALGYVAYRALRTVDDFAVEALITLALVAGGYSLAGALHTSGPIAMVVAGLLIGNHGRRFGMSKRTRQHLDTFWELVDEILNALLFVLIGFEVLILEPDLMRLIAGLVMIPLVILVRSVSVGLPIATLRRVRTFPPHTVKMLTWSGVRGGISIALALSLPPSEMRGVVLVATYVIVVFSILVQGLTVGRLAEWASRPGRSA